MIEVINREFDSLKRQGLPPSQALSIVERKLYAMLPENNDALIELFDRMMAAEAGHLFWLVTMWVKRNKGLYQLSYMPHYENWLYRHTNRWGTCDVLCYRVLNPMVEKYPWLFEKVLKWAESPQTYVRRAAAVSLIQSTRQSFAVNCEVEKVLTIADKLKHDPEAHVQKGVGWLLKYAYLSYPDEVLHYLKSNVDNLPRVIFRYAIEKTPSQIREKLIKL